MERLWEQCCSAAGCSKETARKVVDAFLECITDTLSQGESVDLGKDFGVFTVKLRTPHLQENSPRTPKAKRYKVIFRENSGMKQRLKLPD